MATGREQVRELRFGPGLPGTANRLTRLANGFNYVVLTKYPVVARHCVLSGHRQAHRTAHDEKLFVSLVFDDDVAAAALTTRCSGVVRRFAPLLAGPATLEDVGPGPSAIELSPEERAGCMATRVEDAKPFGPRVKVEVKACPPAPPHPPRPEPYG